MDSQNIRGLIEAYQAVHNPELRQELDEQKDFELWVDSLVEEGYDLSEYTWEEMYDAYLDEKVDYNKPLEPQLSAARDRLRAARSSAAKPAAKPQMRGLSIGKGGFNVNNKPVNPGMSPLFQRQGAKPAASAPAAKPSASAPASRPAAAKPATKPAASAPASRPAAKPAASAPAAKPAAKPAEKPSAMDTWAKANPRLAKAQEIKKQGGSRAEVNKSLYNKGTAAAEKTPTVVKAGFDLFDVVKGYLLDEGHAETEEAAIAIMANMSKEMIDGIIEATGAEPMKIPATPKEIRNRIKERNKKEGPDPITWPGSMVKGV